jgi:hypothetical protein
MACTNLIEGGKPDRRDQSLLYQSGVAFRREAVWRALDDLNRAVEIARTAPIYANRGIVYQSWTS